VVVDGRPLRYYVEELVQRLKASPSLSLHAVVHTFAHDSREALIGSFCALLELVRLEVIEVLQSGPRADIEIRVRAERVAGLEDVVRQARFDEEIVAETPVPAPVQLELSTALEDDSAFEDGSELDDVSEDDDSEDDELKDVEPDAEGLEDGAGPSHS